MHGSYASQDILQECIKRIAAYVCNPHTLCNVLVQEGLLINYDILDKFVELVRVIRPIPILCDEVNYKCSLEELKSNVIIEAVALASEFESG